MKLGSVVKAVVSGGIVIILATGIMYGSADAGMGMMGMKDCPMKGSMMGGGMMGMRMCPMMSGDVKMEVRELKDGVAITYRAKDENTIKRLRLMAEMMKLMQEMMELDQR